MHTSRITPTTSSPSTSTAPAPAPTSVSAVEQALRQARSPHRAAKTGTLTQALPAIRRAHGAGVFAELSLSALYRQRHLLQRKHFLRTLAAEAGFASWEAYLPTLRSQTPQAYGHYTGGRDYGYPNAWFSTLAQAEAYATEHGGHVLRYGQQAMVVPAPE